MHQVSFFIFLTKRSFIINGRVHKVYTQLSRGVALGGTFLCFQVLCEIAAVGMSGDIFPQRGFKFQLVGVCQWLESMPADRRSF